MPSFVTEGWSGWYFDGRTARRIPVAVRVLRDGLAIIFAEGPSRFWPYDRIRQTQGSHRGEPTRLEHGGDPPEALVVPEVAILEAIREAAPVFRRRFRSPARRSLWVAGTAGALVAAPLLGLALYAWGIPAVADAVAVRVPVAWEEQLGAAVTEQLAPAGLRCETGEQAAALEQIVTMLTSSGSASAYRYTLIVVVEDTPNAFAAPGGYVVLTAGLLRLTDRPEELAGVLAHEIQHVAQRHATKLLVRDLSLRALVSLAVGELGGLGSALEAARSLGTLRYQRVHEAAADRGAMRMLLDARIDPQGMITLLDKMRHSPATAPEPPAYLSTHPALDERLATLRRLAADIRSDPVPLLPGYPWAAMERICSR